MRGISIRTDSSSRVGIRRDENSSVRWASIRRRPENPSGGSATGGRGDEIGNALNGIDPSSELRFGPKGSDHDLLTGTRSRAGTTSNDNFLTNSAALVKELVFNSLLGNPTPSPSPSPSSGQADLPSGFVDPEDSSRLSPEEAERLRREALLVSLDDYLTRAGLTESLFARAHRRYQKIQKRWVHHPSPVNP